MTKAEVSSDRLDLVPMSLVVMEALLAGDREICATMVGQLVRLGDCRTLGAQQRLEHPSD
jgi:hypothetical protein